MALDEMVTKLVYFLKTLSHAQFGWVVDGAIINGNGLGSRCVDYGVAGVAQRDVKSENDHDRAEMIVKV